MINTKSRSNPEIAASLPIRDIQPLIVAWTSENLDDDTLRLKIENAGFDLPIESPIIKAKVQEIIQPMMNERTKAIDNQVYISWSEVRLRNLSIQEEYLESRRSSYCSKSARNILGYYSKSS